ncbi:MAG: 5'-nucleotidase C-terminal domain-containing protein [Actinobacteria bacterium]|nr:5'-nucleotidase C-terminal domain-containing protein [Actinomycetota bacterium]
MRRTRPRHARLVAAGVAVSASLIALGSLPAQAAAKPGPVSIQLLNVSDWHGQLDPVTPTAAGAIAAVPTGGAPALAAYFAADRAANPNTLTLTAGDAVGATPPVSAFFEDTPTIQAMRLMRFDADTLGNHNFDAGLARLQRQIDLARSEDPTVPGKRFRYLSANLKNVDDNLDHVDKMRIFTVGGVKVAVIGLTNPEAPGLVFPGNFGTITITDPVVAANKQRLAARKAGAQVVVGLIHAGIEGVNAQGQAFGPLVQFATNVTGFDVILGDHTDFQYSETINGALVTENRSKGVTYSKVNLSVDRKRGVLAKSATFVQPVVSGVTPDQTVADLVAGYRTQLAPILSTQLGSATRAVPRSDSCGRADGRLCESLVGDIATDALRLRYGTDFAITNAGGLRADLTCPAVDSATDFCPAFTPPPFTITRGQVLGVLPFGNVATTTTVSGAELKTFLENGVSVMPGANGRFPQVSGLCFTYDISAAVGSRVTSVVRQAADGTCTGPAVDLTAAASYTIASNDFMANGGDGYPNVIGRSVTRELLDQVLADYVTAASPLAPSIQGRIVCTTSGAVPCPVVTAP